MDYPTVPIAIASSPTDWPTIYAALFAAFFGSAAAFALNIVMDKMRQRRSQLDEINAGIYGLLMSLSTLANFKIQYLAQFKSEFSRAQEILGNINLAGDKAKIASEMQKFNIVIQSVSMQSANLNGAFMPWQELEFAMAPSPTSFHFTIGIDPDLVRLIHIAKTEMRAISKGISDRDSFWQKNSDDALIDMTSKAPGAKGLMFHLQMLSFRDTAGEHVDVALVVATETLKKLESFRKKRFKRRWYLQWIFTTFTGREVWTTYELSEKISNVIPDRAAHGAVLDLQ